MTREAEQRELRLRDDMEKLRIQQEQSLGTLDTKIDTMMERRTQAIMDRLDGLLSSKSGPKEGEPNSRGPSREPKVNFNEHQKRKTYGSRGRGSLSGYATRDNRTWGPNSRASSTGNRQTGRALLTTGDPRIKKLHGRYLEVYGPYQVMLNVEGISIYTRTYVTTDDDQMGQIYLGEEELKVRRIGHDAMMEQDAVHIGYEADVTAHMLDTNGTKIGVTGLLDTGAVVSVMPIKTWERMGFTREDLIQTNLRLAAAN